jgi:hypothetical protein
MAVYWLIFLIPAGAALFPFGKRTLYFSVAWGILYTALVLIVGLRHQVGGDWDTYLGYFQEASIATLTESLAIHGDPAYYALNWILSNSGFDFWTLNLICASIAVGGLMSLSKEQPNPWLAICIAIPYAIIVVSMGYTRQSVSLGLICFAYKSVEKKLPYRFISYVLLASLFHKSALVVLPFFVFALARANILRSFGMAMLIMLALFDFISTSLYGRVETYISGELESSGALVRILLLLPASLLLITSGKKLKLSVESLGLWKTLALIAVLCLVLVQDFSTIVDRFALYLIPLQLVCYSRLYLLASSGALRLTINSFLIAFYSLTLYIWLQYSLWSRYWLPYDFSVL